MKTVSILLILSLLNGCASAPKNTVEAATNYLGKVNQLNTNISDTSSIDLEKQKLYEEFKNYNKKAQEDIEKRNEEIAKQVITGIAVVVLVAGLLYLRANTNLTPLGNPMALCKDGQFSYSEHHQGTCSHHGGVNVWYR